MVRQPGHSLVEMIVALAFLGASLAAITATAVVAVRGTVDAVRLQETTARAVSVLDSIIAGDAPGTGELWALSGTLEWEPVGGAGGGVWLDVRVVDAGGTDTLAALQGAWIPRAPFLPEPLP